MNHNEFKKQIKHIIMLSMAIGDLDPDKRGYKKLCNSLIQQLSQSLNAITSKATQTQIDALTEDDVSDIIEDLF